ncbi:DNA primase [Limnohabitans sp. T6-20]|uniref:DNA primase n=1 Tax=Limnohabitans sp. T6-20 TaxID=1100725 RepID=UPI000D33B476|nr:DNA primase [Limnohabitans sp. T6-20]PUE10063.1 DNA primase [Limnohabitans sp. T6-20]
MAIPQSFIQELLSRVDVVDIVGKYVQLKKGGANFMGLCPFHGEKSPSFSVSPTKQFFHCFGCGKNGNAIGFLMEHAGMTFIEAVKDLAQQTGMQVPEEQQSPEDRAKAAAQKAKQDSLSDVLEKAGQAYREQLRITPRAVEYLKGRGLSGQIAKRFGLGYAPEGWRSLASVFPKYDDPLLAESGLVIVNEEDDKRYDRFRDRIMFPIRNIKGECIGFGGRVIGSGTPKYLNSPETPVFHKGRELYGLYEAREALHSAGYVLVTEGYMDVVALAQLGFANAVATLGTACTPDHVQKLFRFTDAVVFSFDGDGAGRRAARKALDGALPYATDVRSIKFLFLPAEHDPDSYVREFGQDAFAEQIKQAMPLSRFLIEAASADCDLQTAEGRARLSSQARPLWQLLPDGALKQQLLSELAQLIQLETAGLEKLWGQQAASDQRFAPRSNAPAAAPSMQTANAALQQATHAGGDEHHAFEPHYGEPPAWASDSSYGSGSGAPAYGGAYSNAGGKFSGNNWPRKNPNWTPNSKFGNSRYKRDQAPVYTGPRTVPASRADHAARLLLGNMALWETLAGEDHAMLCALPAPHGPLFAWLESVFHEQGALGWTALQTEMQSQAFAEDAVRWMAQDNLGVTAGNEDATPPDPQEARQELRRLLNMLLIDRLKQLETEALAQASTGQDPEAQQRWRSLHERRKELMASAAAALLASQ